MRLIKKIKGTFYYGFIPLTINGIGTGYWVSGEYSIARQKESISKKLTFHKHFCQSISDTVRHHSDSFSGIKV